jgi:hypothetical protein
MSLHKTHERLTLPVQFLLALFLATLLNELLVDR